MKLFTSFLVLCICQVFITRVDSQPVSQILGFLEVFDSSDSTSTYIGRKSGQMVTANLKNNVSLGSYSAFKLTSGYLNTFIGYNSGRFTTDGVANTFIGGGAGQNNNSGYNNVFVGSNTANISSSGYYNAFIGSNSGQVNTSGSCNSSLGYLSGGNNTTSTHNTFLGYNTRLSADGIDHSTAIGYDTQVETDSTIKLGNSWDKTIATGRMIIGNKTVPRAPLSVYANAGPGEIYLEGSGSFAGIKLSSSVAGMGANAVFTIAHFDGTTANNRFAVNSLGHVEVGLLGSAGATALCRNGSSEIASCSSSIRYKEEVVSYANGMELIDQMRPVSYKWKGTEVYDLGLIAEEIAEIEPLLIVYNDKNEIEGIKYDRIIPILINALKRQENIIQSQAKSISDNQLNTERMEKRLAKIEAVLNR